MANDRYRVRVEVCIYTDDEEAADMAAETIAKILIMARASGMRVVGKGISFGERAETPTPTPAVNAKGGAS